MSNKEICVPDIGDFTDVELIEILVSVGDTVAVEDPLITLESDKASMEIPAPEAGVVKEIKVSIGDTLSEGSLILLLESAASASTPAEAPVKNRCTRCHTRSSYPCCTGYPCCARNHGSGRIVSII